MLHLNLSLTQMHSMVPLQLLLGESLYDFLHLLFQAHTLFDLPDVVFERHAREVELAELLHTLFFGLIYLFIIIAFFKRVLVRSFQHLCEATIAASQPFKLRLRLHRSIVSKLMRHLLFLFGGRDAEELAELGLVWLDSIRIILCQSIDDVQVLLVADDPRVVLCSR